MTKDKKKKSRPIPVQFDYAQTVEAIAKKLIPKYHSHLVNCTMAYLFKNKVIVQGGKTVVATAERASAKMKAISIYNDSDYEPVDFIITVSYPAWNALTDKQKYAVVDHELNHCFVVDDEDEEAGEKQLKILSHDVAEFNSTIQRFGLYMPDLEKMKMVMDKQEAPDDEDEDEDE